MRTRRRTSEGVPPAREVLEVKRDINLIRELLQRLEALPLRMSEMVVLSPDAKELAVEGYSDDEIEYHLSLIRA